MNWCSDATGKKPQRELHPQDFLAGLEGRLPDYWSFNYRDINEINVEKKTRYVLNIKNKT